MVAADVQKLQRAPGIDIAYRKRGNSKNVGITWLGGFRSDMEGTKATFLDDVAETLGLTYVRFDYQGHGQSSGRFEDGTIGLWKDDALAIIDQVTEGPQILVGSSMGGWISLVCALERPERVQAVVLIAPAPDFTEDLMWGTFPPEVQQKLQQDGSLTVPDEYGEEPYVITHKLIEDGRRYLMLRDRIPIECPVRIMHGMADEAVPWQRSFDLADRIVTDDVLVVLNKRGDHRLSAEDDLRRLRTVIASLL